VDRFPAYTGRVTYLDRAAAGAALAKQLTRYAGRPDVAVLGLVRGGVPVAAEVASRLGAPLDLLVIRKLGVPWAREVAFGALGPNGVQVFNNDIASRLTRSAIAAVLDHESAELARREELYRPGRPPPDLRGRTVILIDDGLATGASARAGAAVAYRLGARRVVVAVPVGSMEAVAHLAPEVDEVVCVWQPTDFRAVSRYYDNFGQVTDKEVIASLGRQPGATSDGRADAPA
jgi:putative phosphoribosyl transferase